MKALLSSIVALVMMALMLSSSMAACEVTLQDLQAAVPHETIYIHSVPNKGTFYQIYSPDVKEFFLFPKTDTCVDIKHVIALNAGQYALFTFGMYA